MEKEVYLDNSATTKCFPEAAELMNRIYLTDYGNPSSMHHNKDRTSGDSGNHEIPAVGRL